MYAMLAGAGHAAAVPTKFASFLPVPPPLGGAHSGGVPSSSSGGFWSVLPSMASFVAGAATSWALGHGSPSGGTPSIPGWLALFDVTESVLKPAVADINNPTEAELLALLPVSYPYFSWWGRVLEDQKAAGLILDAQLMQAQIEAAELNKQFQTVSAYLKGQGIKKGRLEALYEAMIRMKATINMAMESMLGSG